MFTRIRSLFVFSLVAAVSWGCVADSLPEKIEIGVALPLTGPQILYGAPAWEGFQFALEEINGSSILGGSNIEFIREDSRGTVDAATKAFNKLIKEDGVSVILGPGISTVAKEVFPIAQKSEVLALSSTSTAVGLSAIGDYIFRTGLNVGTLAPGAVKGTKEKLGYRKVAIMVDSTDVYSLSLDEELRNALAENEVQILTRETFATGDTSFADQLSRIMALKPQAVFVSCLAAEMIQVLVNAHEVGVTSMIPMIIPELSLAEVKKAGDAAEGAISVLSWASNASTPGNQAFVENYIARYGYEPHPWGAISYVSLVVLAKAIAETGSMDASEIKRAMINTREVDTILGRFSFNPDGDAVYNPIVLKVRNGAFEVFK